ncbi:hypothetical protein AMP9_0486 [plant metagenome]|uniref:Uncharacterized protein n=1 Tax=plant metagenome TaxID=1297885 RepID=A0A484NVX2_9ZZZZ
MTGAPASRGAKPLLTKKVTGSSHLRRSPRAKNLIRDKGLARFLAAFMTVLTKTASAPLAAGWTLRRPHPEVSSCRPSNRKQPAQAGPSRKTQSSSKGTALPAARRPTP